MLSARAHSLGNKVRLAVSLSWVAGYTNAVFYLICGGVFISHVTGSATRAGISIVKGDWADALFFPGLCCCFMFGAALSSLLLELASRADRKSRYIMPLAVQCILILAAMFTLGSYVAHPHPSNQHLLNAPFILATFAMGLQNATVTRISGNIVRTTHLTGVVTDLGLEGVQFLFWLHDERRNNGLTRMIHKMSGQATAQRLFVLASICGSFGTGVICGAYAVCHLDQYSQHYSLLLPASFLLFILLRDAIVPIADIEAIDTVHDAEMHAFGIEHTKLPPGVALFRITLPNPETGQKPPDFQNWIEHLPQETKVVVLELHPAVDMNKNSALDLEQAIDKIKSRGGRLLLAGMTPQRYQEMDKFGLIQRIGADNVFPDIEFAVAIAGSLGE